MGLGLGLGEGEGEGEGEGSMGRSSALICSGSICLPMRLRLATASSRTCPGRGCGWACG